MEHRLVSATHSCQVQATPKLEPLLEKIGREPKTCVLPSDGAILKFRGLTFRVAISMRVFRSSQRSFTTVSTKRIKDVEEKDINA